MNCYVYEHVDPFTFVPFYVGKGTDDRAWRFDKDRNPHHRNKADKIRRKGREPLVFIMGTGLSTHGAFEFEKERIAHYRATGIKLCNVGDGGEGVQHTVEVRAKISARFKGKPLTPEHRLKLSVAKKGRPVHPALVANHVVGRTISPEHRAKIGSQFRGKPLSVEHRAKIGKANLGRTPSAEARARMSKSATARYAKRKEDQ